MPWNISRLKWFASSWATGDCPRPCDFRNCDQRFSPLIGALPTMLLVRSRDDYAGIEAIDAGVRRPTAMPRGTGTWLGTTIVAHRFDFRELRLLDLATGKWETLARGLLHFANWSRDSRYVFFESWNEDTAVIRIRIQDRQREKVGALKEFRRTVGPERCWSGLTPDNSLLVLRDVGSQEIYALTLDAR